MVCAGCSSTAAVEISTTCTTGPGRWYGVCDVREPEQVESVVDGLLAHYGQLDVVVNNAAGNFPATLDNISYNGFRSIVGIDLLGVYNVSKACYEKWLKEHGGNVVNISAPFAGMGVALQAHVAAAKTAVDSLTRTCAVEWGRPGDAHGEAPFDEKAGKLAEAVRVFGDFQGVRRVRVAFAALTVLPADGPDGEWLPALAEQNRGR